MVLVRQYPGTRNRVIVTIMASWTTLGLVLYARFYTATSWKSTSDYFNLGPINANGVYGDIEQCPKYENMTLIDLYASLNLRSQLEALRPNFEHDRYPVPRLDPYRDTLPPTVYIEKEGLQATIQYRHLKLKETRKFQIHALEVRLSSQDNLGVHCYRIDYIIGFPKLRAELSYDAHVKIEEVHNYPSSGHAKIIAYDIVISGTLIASAPVTLNPRLTFEAHHFNLTNSNVQYHFENKYNMLWNAYIIGRRAVVSAVADATAQAAAQYVADKLTLLTYIHSEEEIKRWLLKGAYKLMH